MVLDQTPEMQPLPAPTPFLQMVDNGATVSQQINYVTAAFIEPVVSGGLAFFKMGADAAAGNYNALIDDGIKALTMLLGFKGGEYLAKAAEFTLKIKQMAFDAERIAQGVISKSPLEFLKKGSDGLQLNVIKDKVIDPTNPTAPPVEVTKILTPEELAKQSTGDLTLNPDSITYQLSPKGVSCFVAGTLVHTREGLVPIEQIKVGDWVLSKPESGVGEQAYKRVTKTFRTEDKEVQLVDIIPGSVFARAELLKQDPQIKECVPELLRGEMRQYLAVTPNHPFWINGVGWMEASEICSQFGYGVTLLNGELAAISSERLYHTPLFPGVAWWAPEGLEVDGMNPVDLYHGEVQADLRSSKSQSWPDPEIGPWYPESILRQTVYNLEVEDYHTYYVGRMGVWVHNCDLGEVTTSQKVRDLYANPELIPSIKDLNNLTPPHTGLQITQEGLLKSRTGQTFQEQANGAQFDPATSKFNVPALRMDAAKYKAETGRVLDQNYAVGDALAKMSGQDGVFSKTLIDASSGDSKFMKRDPVSGTDQLNTDMLLKYLDRISFALKENPGFSWVLEVENAAGANMIKDYIVNHPDVASRLSKDFYVVEAAKPLIDGAQRELPDNLTGFAKGVDAAGNEVWGAVGINKMDVLRSLDDGSLAQQPACFMYDTMVWMDERPIEIQFIEPGMEVLSRCEETGEIRSCKVTKAFVREDVSLYYVYYTDDEGYKYTTGTTAEHPFWVRGMGWTEVRKLKPGHILELHTGQTATISEVKDANRRTNVYNIEVEGFHTYFVDAGVWVHNKNGSERALPMNLPDAAFVENLRKSRVRYRLESQVLTLRNLHQKVVPI
jgi:hypothetical protein